MEFGEQIEAPKQGENTKLADETRERMFSELFTVGGSDRAVLAKASTPPLVVGEGQVARMVLPNTWRDGRTLKNVHGNSSYHELNAADDKDSKLSFFDRGTPMTDASAKAFHDVLARPPHNLNAAEVASLRELLRGKGDSTVFEFNAARTENLNGRRVLCLEGLYKEDSVAMRAVLVAANATASVVQEIEYQAPKAKYQAHLNEVNAAFKSIVWK
jgi:hypothetical protein